MYRVHDPMSGYQVEIREGHEPRTKGVRFLKVQGLSELRKLTEDQFEQMKEKARRWQPTSR